MKIVVSPQAFKGSFTALEACLAIQQGILRVYPSAEIILIPVADGGDGTLDVLLNERKGVYQKASIKGFFKDSIDVPWGIIDRTAIIEMAKVCGIASMKYHDLNPLSFSTYGLGELITHCLDKGLRKFLIGLGGSATNDGGMGMARALGVRFLDAQGKELSLQVDSLLNLEHIDVSGLDSRLSEAQFTVACDVSNPLTGPSGASRMFGPQKGASEANVTIMEKAMLRLSEVMLQDLGLDVFSIKGAGAGGGTGAGLFAFLKAKLLIGSELILDALNYNDQIKGASLVITGEGCLDLQTCFDKAPIAVAKRAHQLKIPVLAIVGRIGTGYEQVFCKGIGAVIPLTFYSESLLSSSSITSLSLAVEQALRCTNLFLERG